MSTDYNNITMIARLTKDPIVRTTQAGINVTNFSVANNRGKDMPTVFFDVTAWGKLAQFAREHLRKASKVLISGRIDLDKYTDKAGIEKEKFVITADGLHFIDSKPKDNDQKFDQSQDWTSSNDINF
jgi:single-strand DNA-binding protein